MLGSDMRPFFILLIITSLANSHNEPCLEYGCPGRPQYEPFVPAPPGHTPNCAKPGQTFCESPDHYPRQLIKFLVEKCSFDFSSVLRDESKDDFNIYRSVPDYAEGYDYTPHRGPQLHSQPLPFLPPQYPLRGQPALIYGSPSNDTHQNGYRYSTPAQRNPFLVDGTPSVKYHPVGQRTPERHFYSQSQSLNSFGQGQTWWANRYTRNSKAAPRSVYENPLLKYSNPSKMRNKRQSNLDSIPLCPTVPQYITPRAALNNQGNWMYVVNLQDQNQKYSQIVKSEKCSTSTCNALCSVPAGYTSKCQQQYVQKRLVALEGSGNQLYTDVFWFPHGCSCQIMLNY
ncbi:protein spaetzle 5 isoform X1 [Osmia bicornis bicornis]|uniref:protein spaetzle 5 isoform X1 n=1 Tax=Osmia bicornis bicornis TaxID=1437191 RepID=UPI0010F6E743|nr:protein spaetzle 5 isoform X1 [Osmia bicornis bicornis]XP_029048875.1 protein spaetzle 5 isoform X1 [Osmia bicornis bicornis]XP_029048884.1 protein spaetzle 5 isoform X1 [Osmia bicornis bicornis]